MCYAVLRFMCIKIATQNIYVFIVSNNLTYSNNGTISYIEYVSRNDSSVSTLQCLITNQANINLLSQQNEVPESVKDRWQTETGQCVNHIYSEEWLNINEKGLV